MPKHRTETLAKSGETIKGAVSWKTDKGKRLMLLLSRMTRHVFRAESVALRRVASRRDVIVATSLNNVYILPTSALFHSSENSDALHTCVIQRDCQRYPQSEVLIRGAAAQASEKLGLRDLS